MQFPKWVDNKKNDPELRAQLRLRHMLSQALLDKHGRVSMRDLAKMTNFDHTTIHYSIKRGYFKKDFAIEIEAALGKKFIRHEDLIDPLNA